MYLVKEIFYSLQGEGANAGRPAIFCRFSGCNLWSGREDDRASALCRFCDTDFRADQDPCAKRYGSAKDLALEIIKEWPPEADDGQRVFVVFTGGEPLLQLDVRLIQELQKRGCEVAVETNGTLEPPAGIDWLTASPKAGAPFVITYGDELKLVFPQKGCDPNQFAGMNFRHFFLQPLDDPDIAENTRRALHYCLEHPKWRLSLQIHKILGIR